MEQLLGAIWLLGLFAAAPALRADEPYEFVDRLRDALILGVAIPFALGFFHALYPLACWAALALCAAIAYRKERARRDRPGAPALRPPYVLIAALVVVAWPPLMRPLLDGDSLSYHLPNAAAWTQAHSLWTTATRYWWYPPASELFASALYAVGSPFALPWSGFGALALLGFRIVAWAREAFGAGPLVADALGAATVSLFPLAIQGGTLQNDVWLAAFFTETLWSLRNGASRAAPRTIAVTALLKPQGWILTLIALAASRAKLALWYAAFAPLGLWAVRDLILWQAATLSSAPATTPNLWSSSIAAHGFAAVGLLGSVAAHDAPFALPALMAALLGPLAAGRERALGWAALGATLVFVALPYGYETDVAQLATGASLRFAAPAIAAGALILGLYARRAPLAAVPLLLLSVVYGCWFVTAIFWNDASTHAALPIAALACAIVAAASRARVWWPSAVACLLAVAAATQLAARHPLDYYNDALRVGDISPGVYRWIVTKRPAAVGGWGLRLGVVNVLAPETRTRDLPDTHVCAHARATRVLLVAIAQDDIPRVADARRLYEARTCGRVLYEDPLAVVARP